jgi:RNA polymerase sigma factor (TIGR02999 family)
MRSKEIIDAQISCRELWPRPARDRSAQSLGVDIPIDAAAPDNAFDAASLTGWLSQLDAQDAATHNRLFTALYDELRALAGRHMRREGSDHTLSATGLAHEAWFRLAEQTRSDWRNRSHFLAVASTMMRRILINHAMAHRANKRDAELVPLTLSGLEQISGSPGSDIVAVHEALLAFEAIDPRAAKVVELRFFGGLENEEIAQLMQVSVPTVKRDWALARAWLRREMGAAPSA